MNLGFLDRLLILSRLNMLLCSVQTPQNSLWSLKIILPSTKSLAESTGSTKYLIEPIIDFTLYKSAIEVCKLNKIVCGVLFAL